MAENYQLYGSIVKGFRYGGGNFDLGEAITGKIPPTYESDELWSYELGLRTDWLDGAVQADVTVFYIEWGDTQVNLLSEGGATQFNFIANVGAAEVQGFELSAKAALPFDLTLSGNTAYSDAIIVDAFDAPRGYVPSGTGMPNSPHWTASAVLAHSAYFNNWQLFSMLSVAYRSDAKHDYINPIVLEEHATFGAAIQLVNSSLPFSPELRFSVTNLTDEDEILTTNTSGDTNVDDGNIKATTVTPRTTVFSLKLNF